MTRANSVVVVTPTYNERANLEELVKKIFALEIRNLKMMIVDDNSPDGTGELAEKLAKTYPIFLLHRPRKIGLGPAYVEAFRKIFVQKPDIIIQMDADLSHDPAVIPQMLKKIEHFDLVVGSRYVPGGKIENWDWLRKLISYFGNIYARTILHLPYSDLTSGFKCWHRETLEKINLEKLSSAGYNFQIETLFAAHRAKSRILEIPIVFTERKKGVSKFNLQIIIESFFKVLWLGLHG